MSKLKIEKINLIKTFHINYSKFKRAYPKNKHMINGKPHDNWTILPWLSVVTLTHFCPAFLVFFLFNAWVSLVMLCLDLKKKTMYLVDGSSYHQASEGPPVSWLPRPPSQAICSDLNKTKHLVQGPSY